jgi:uncharacterized ion transporter superfamily protein YfcC
MSIKKKSLLQNLQFPAAQTILLIIAALVAILTWIVPAGSYDTLLYNASDQTFIRTSKGIAVILPANKATLDSLQVKIPLEKFTGGAIYKPIGIPNTYQNLPSQPQSFFDFVQAPIKGIIEASDIIFLVLFIGGLVGIMNTIGAFNAGIAWLSKALKGKEFLLIIVTTVLIALGGTTFGLAEETIAFLPILVPVFVAAKYDSLVGMASIYLGSAVGVMCSTVNPFSTIIASDSAGISWTSGLSGRVIMFCICITITILYILYYARKVKKDATKSIIYEDYPEMKKNFGIDPDQPKHQLTHKLRLILFIFLACFVIMIVGVSQLDWWFIEMTSVFFVGAIVIGFIAKMKESAFIESFVKGAGDLLGVVFIIGLARGISILMNDGLISDTILHTASDFTSGMDKLVFTNALFFIYQVLAFFVPSSSGMAVLTMPILSPLADTVQIGREIIVNAFQYGHGLFQLINPTGIVLASLGIVKIGYNKWLKFVLPLYVVLALIVVLVLSLTIL